MGNLRENKTKWSFRQPPPNFGGDKEGRFISHRLSCHLARYHCLDRKEMVKRQSISYRLASNIRVRGSGGWVTAALLWLPEVVNEVVNGKEHHYKHDAPHGKQGEIQLGLNEKGNLNIN